MRDRRTYLSLTNLSSGALYRLRAVKYAERRTYPRMAKSAHVGIRADPGVFSPYGLVRVGIPRGALCVAVSIRTSVDTE